MLQTISSDPWFSWRGVFSELDRLRQDMDSLLKGVTGAWWLPESTGLFPLLNVSEDKDNFYVRAELPGIAPSDLDISVTGKTLTIQGERKAPQAEEGARYHRRERSFASFSRAIGLPCEVEPDKVTAESKDGILTITLPKVEEAKPKQIAVKAA